MTAQHYSCDLNTTPSRKRKRHCEKVEEHKENDFQTTSSSCFTNAAFCSTPKKIVAKRRFQLNKTKEKVIVSPKVSTEAKISAENNCDVSEIQINPYEVLRKPPKKKKRNTEDLACFENPALNLEIPEKLFNPYEVVRKKTDNINPNCFSNPALNLKVHDASILCNPFEVQRQESLKTEVKAFVKNPFLSSPKANNDLTPKPCQLKLGLPFAPNLGCRIDFKDVSMSQLTPSKLLAEKLVFSPVQKVKLQLDSIGEESPTDIGKELDRYQLELENSINEAKLQKTSAHKGKVLSPADSNCEIKFDFKQKSRFIQKLCEIPENVENNQFIEETRKQTEPTYKTERKENNKYTFENNIVEKIPSRHNLNEVYQKTETAEVIAIENINEELYGCCADGKEDSFDFQSPAPFVRAYTRQEPTKLTVSTKSLEQLKTGENEEHVKKTLNVKNIIRKSIRKLVHTQQQGRPEKKTEEQSNKEPENEKQKGLMNAIRHSFRRKATKKSPDEELETQNEISIIDYSERTMKFKTDVLFSEYMNVEDLTNEKRMDLRKSLRKSTRDVRNQFLKSVFHKKNEEYDLSK